MKQTIEDRFQLNIARVKNLVQIYGVITAGTGQGRKGHQQTDVLRAAVVLLHASMEDVLRSLAHWKLPASSALVLDEFPLVGTGPNTKFSLGALSAHKGKSVNDVIKASVDKYLERSNYNNNAEVAKLLGQIGLNASAVNHTFPLLEEVMKRRHLIVHRADKDDVGGRGNHRVKSLGPSTVNSWIFNVEAFVNAVLAQV